MTFELFPHPPGPNRSSIGAQALVLHGFAATLASDLLVGIRDVSRVAPFRNMTTPHGFEMSVAMTNCGRLGWTSDRRGYRYAPQDPVSEQAWPDMPAVFRQLARDAARAAGFSAFEPDACLINRYQPGTQLTLHQDKNERDRLAPIVSVSLGVAAVFLFGGHTRRETAERVPLLHGDVAVWGGVDRMRFHGVQRLNSSSHPATGNLRFNLTFRRVA